MSEPEDRAIAIEIVRQIGGFGPLRAMIGAKDIMAIPRGLKFRWAAKSKNGANAVRVILAPSDTYAVEFWSLRGLNSKLIKSFDDIYADSLRELFERETGLYLRL